MPPGSSESSPTTLAQAIVSYIKAMLIKADSRNNLRLTPQRRDLPLLAEPSPPQTSRHRRGHPSLAAAKGTSTRDPLMALWPRLKGDGLTWSYLAEHGPVQRSRPEPELGPCSGERSRHDPRRPAGETPRSSKLAMPVRSRSPAPRGFPRFAREFSDSRASRPSVRVPFDRSYWR